MREHDGLPNDRALVFAYGSNMCTARLRERTPGARKITNGRLDGYRLTFHKRGADGSGKGMPAGGAPSDSIAGVLFSIPHDQMPELDRVEGGYEKRAVTIRSDDGSREALTYFPEPSMVDERLRPFGWYLALIRAGIREHGLPAHCIAAIDGIEHDIDPDEDRRMKYLGMADAQ